MVCGHSTMQPTMCAAAVLQVQVAELADDSEGSAAAAADPVQGLTDPMQGLTARLECTRSRLPCLKRQLG